jgi:glutamyl-tRNA synthetase
MSHVIRMKIPQDQKIKFNDVLMGEVEFASNLIDHQVIIKSDGFPTYHLASVVDDYLMKITHVFRGQEWLPSVPKHQLLWQSLGWENEMPQYIHLPVILNNEGGGKLSKRHGHASVDYYKDEGYLPEAILNYLANIVWNHPEEGKEIFPFMDLARALHVDPDKKLTKVDIYSQGPRFDLEKLKWMNGEYIRALSDDELTKRLIEFYKETIDDHEKIRQLAPLVKERIKTLRDFELLTDFIFEGTEYDLAVFGKINIEDPKAVLEKILEKLTNMQKPWTQEQFEQNFRNLSVELTIPARELFQLIRVAISGKLVSPPLLETMEILGEEESTNKVKKAIEFLT